MDSPVKVIVAGDPEKLVKYHRLHPKRKKLTKKQVKRAKAKKQASAQRRVDYLKQVRIAKDLSWILRED